MAEQITHDVVKEAQSMGGPAPIDDTATTTNHSAGNGEASSDPNSITLQPSEPTSTDATSAEAVRDDSTTTSDKAGGDAAAVSEPECGAALPTNSDRLLLRMPMVSRKPILKFPKRESTW
jgi:hypothetical protein